MATVVELPDKTQIEFPDGMDEETIQTEIQKAFPNLAPAPAAPSTEQTISQRPAITAPGEVQPLLGRAPLMTPVPQAFPAVEQRIAQSQAESAERQPKFEPLTDETLSAAVRQEPPAPEAEIQPIGEPGTVMRGVSTVAAGVLNRPEYLAALMNPATAAAVAVRFAPDIVMQFREDVGLAAQGDREALGRALAIGAPVLAGAALRGPANIKGGIDVRGVEAVADATIKPVAPMTAEAVKATARELTPEAPKETVAASVAEQPFVKLEPTEVAPEVQKPSQPIAAAESVVEPKAADIPAPEAVGKVEPAASIPEPPKVVEPTPEGSPTGIKNATVERERAARGLPSAVEPARRDFGSVWDEAMSRIDKDPASQEVLIAELREKPRALTDVEDATLLQRQITLQSDYAKASNEMTKAFDEGRLADAEAVKARVGELSNELLDLYNINKAAGTETGRGLAARKMMANEDFTLAKMEVDARVAKGGKPLTDAERAETVRVAEEFQRVNRELEAKLAEKDKALSEAQLARSIAEMQATAAKESLIAPGVQRVVERVGKVLDTRADAARKRLAGKLFSLSPDVLKDLAEIGASNIYHIGMDLAKWSAKMVADLGEKVRPHLEKVWEASIKLLDEVTDTTAGPATANVKSKARQVVRAKDTPAEKIDKLQTSIKKRFDAGDTGVGSLVQKLARAVVESGVKEREALIDSVHQIIADISPEWTRRDTMDAISGYGSVKLLKKDEVSTRLRELKGEMQQLAKLEDMSAGEAPLKTGLERRTPSEVEKQLIKAVNEAKRKGNYKTTDPETQLRSALDQVKARMKSEIADLERRIKERDFSKKTPKEVKLDEEALTLEHRLEQIKRSWNEKLLEKRLAEENAAQKAVRWTGETLNTIRAILTSGEFSAVLRQGKFSVLSHPIRGAKALPEMFRAFVSEKQAFKSERDIQKRANYPLYKRAKLYLAEEGTSLSKMEEAYMSRWAKKIPIVAGSARAYTAFLNRIRTDSFDAMASTLGKGGKVTPEEASVIANFINVATGRGSIAIGEKAAVGLSTIFFAPRFVASRFQMALGQPLLYGALSGKAPLATTARARKLVAAEYGRLLAGYGVIYGLANLAGYKIGSDPRSSDFGKIIIGDTRVDPLAGLSQVSVLMSRLASGEKATIKGKVSPIRGKVPYGGDTSAGVIGNFLRTKLAPWPGAALDVAVGKNVIGEPVTPSGMATRMLVPITYQDILDTMEEQGIPRGTALTLLAIFGEGVQTYNDKRPKP